MKQETELEALEEVVVVVPRGRGVLAPHDRKGQLRSKINAAAVKDRKPVSLARTSLERKP